MVLCSDYILPITISVAVAVVIVNVLQAIYEMAAKQIKQGRKSMAMKRKSWMLFHL